MSFKIGKLMQVAQPVSEKVKEEANYRKENKRWLRNSAQVALAIIRQLRKAGITQQELANRMEVSAQYIGRILKGQENFTFETISKLEDALGIKLMTIHNGETVPVQASQVIILSVSLDQKDDWSPLHAQNRVNKNSVKIES